jgi:hypothetical protein
MDLIAAAAAALAQLLILKSSQIFPELESSVLFDRSEVRGNWVLADHVTNCEQFIGGLCNRGYYKCSVKECNAKKTVQPTDEDPSLFEVTYVGEHTCSSSSKAGSAAHPRKRLQRIKAVTTAGGAVVATENHDSRVLSSAVNTSTSATPTITNAGTTAAAETSCSPDQWQIIPTTGRSSQQQVFTTAVTTTTTTTITQGGSSDVEELESSIEGRGSTDSTSTSCTAGSDDDDDWARTLEAVAAAADEDGGDQTDDIDSYLNGSSADGLEYALIAGYLQNDDSFNDNKHLSDSSESLLWRDLMQSSDNLTAQISNLLTIELQS